MKRITSMSRATIAGVALGIPLLIGAQQTDPGQPPRQPGTPQQERQPGNYQPGQNPQGTPGQNGNPQGQLDQRSQAWLKKTIDSGNFEVRLGMLGLQRAGSPAVKQFSRMIVQDHTQLNTRVQQLAARFGVSSGPTFSQNSGAGSGTQGGAQAGQERSQPATPGQAPSPTGREQTTRQQGTPQDQTQGNNPGSTESTPGQSAPGAYGQNSTRAQGSAGANAQFSAEHQQLFNRLSQLQGQDFDRQFMAQMVKDHQKGIQHFESGQRSVQNPEIQRLITDGLPHLRQHLQQAQSIQAQLGGSTSQDTQSQGNDQQPGQNPDQNQNQNQNQTPDQNQVRPQK